MRTSTIALAEGGYALTLQYPNSVAFIYSRQPVIATFTQGANNVAAVNFTVMTGNMKKSHTESRALFNAKAEVDISRIMQLLAADVDSVLRRLDGRKGASLANTFYLSLSVTTRTGADVVLLKQSEGIVGMFGALDQGEIYGEHTQRRLWVNLPQTFNLWKDANDEQYFVTDTAYIYPTVAARFPCNECDFMEALEEAGETELIASLKSGIPIRNVGLTWRHRIEGGVETEEELRTVTLVPDCRTRYDGTYLRWINRRGELSYWLFTNSKLRVTSTLRDTFSRYYKGDPASLVRLGYVNPQKASYREAREMVLSASGLSLDEFEDLCDLATSPVVERLVVIDPEDTGTDVVLDGNLAGYDSTNVLVQTGTPDEVEGGDADTATHEIVNTWQRVNVAAGTFERNIRRRTPSRQDLEIIIELPERNTIQL